MNNGTKGWDDLSAVQESLIEKNNLLLIDGNNLAYRYLMRSNYADYEEEYIRTVMSLAKSYKAKRTIVLFDFGKSYYRIELYPEYKATRKKPEGEEEQKKYDEFFKCLNGIADNLESESIESYKCRGIEADDLITFFKEDLSEQYDEVWIISSDKDLYQLLDFNTFIFNMFSRKEITEDSLLEKYDCSPEEFILAKIIQGDSSDNIKGIEGIGEIRSLSLALKYKTLKNLLDNLPIKGSRAKYMQNLNAGKDILLANEKLIMLKKYNKKAIETGKNGEQVWEMLKAYS